ncbi:MAG TPA: DNA polymerase/3'-5' exonuclease PolX [Candidatus Bathyarchaeia archaeon]|nr:DNA polymerase/3'-5' exonuclease PolX [Candidatus Bathyarchaeia archaeon]
MNNSEIAKLLRVIAAAYEIKGESRFRVLAYERAATAVDQATSEVKDLWEDNQLVSLPGIGTSIASHLGELFRIGTVKHFEEVLKGLPPAVFEFLDIPGIGVKSAWKLYQNLGINRAEGAIKKLEKAASLKKIRLIKGFGKESEKNLLRAIRELKRRERRILLPFAWQLARKLIAFIKEEKTVLRVDPLGSLRRKCATIGDIDLAVATDEPKKVIARFVDYPDIKRLIEVGKTTASVMLRSGHSVDLMTKPPSAYGALLQHFTGSKQHNIHLRKIAQKKGLSLSEYGVKRKLIGGGSKLDEYADEKNFYQAIGLSWIPPELREDTGEIEAAQERKLPVLVEISDIKGDLHLHSSFQIEPSHDLGESSMKEMISEAIRHHYTYLAFSEHNPSVSQHSARQIIDLLRLKKELIERINYSSNKSNLNLKLFNALEVDIKPDGRLALPAEGLEMLDFAIVAIHSGFRITREKMTRRILYGLNHPKVKILAHPTGRKLGKREEYELDWDKIFDFCLKHDKALEINAFPERLDLPDALVREAVKRRVKIAINSDAHSLREMNNIEYGVSVARRGWVEKKDILNSYDCDRISQWLITK